MENINKVECYGKKIERYCAAIAILNGTAKGVEISDEDEDRHQGWDLKVKTYDDKVYKVNVKTVSRENNNTRNFSLSIKNLQEYPELGVSEIWFCPYIPQAIGDTHTVLSTSTCVYCCDLLGDTNSIEALTKSGVGCERSGDLMLYRRDTIQNIAKYTLPIGKFLNGMMTQ